MTITQCMHTQSFVNSLSQIESLSNAIDYYTQTHLISVTLFETTSHSIHMLFAPSHPMISMSQAGPTAVDIKQHILLSSIEHHLSHPSCHNSPWSHCFNTCHHPTLRSMSSHMTLEFNVVHHINICSQPQYHTPIAHCLMMVTIHDCHHMAMSPMSLAHSFTMSPSSTHLNAITRVLPSSCASFSFIIVLHLTRHSSPRTHVPCPRIQSPHKHSRYSLHSQHRSERPVLRVLF